MVTMVTQRMVDSLSCMILAKEEFQASALKARYGSGALDDTKAQVDPELARENSLLRRELLEASADNDAISKSLQERAQSLIDMTDAKIRAETETKVLQVQLKSMQHDLDTHKYDLHLLRKQLQIRNQEKEHHKRASDAAYKQHLENVKKIVRLESECERLRALVRQRLPGPTAIAQMRAECEIHLKMGIRKASLSPVPSSTSKNSSKLHAQREIEGLRERLLCVEDEAKFLKEAMAKRTAELQEARQLCARTAMKLSAAQDLVESMSVISTEYSMPSTPQSGVHLFNSSNHLHALHNQAMIMLKPGNVNNEDNGVHASPAMLGGDVGIHSEHENRTYNINGELDEASCAESWASALFTELSHLSNIHENSGDATESLGFPEEAYNHVKSDMVNFNADVQELDIVSALEKVNHRLSIVGENILTSGLADGHQGQAPNVYGGISGSHSSGLMSADVNDNVITCKNGNTNDILEEILQIKGLLCGIERTMATSGKLESAGGSANFSYVTHVNDDEAACSGELFVKQDGQIKASMHRGTSLSRLRFNSLEDGDNKVATLDTKFSEETDKMEEKISGGTDKVGGKFGEEPDELCVEVLGDGGITIAGKSDAIKIGEKTDKLEEMGTKVSDESLWAAKMIRAGDEFSGGSTVNNGGKAEDDVVTNCSGAAGDTANGSLPLNLAGALADSKLAGEGADVVPELEGEMELERLLKAALDEVELTRGRIATLEVELACSLQEKADVANELSDMRTQKQSLEAELARALASVEALQHELLSLQAQAATHQGSSSPLQSGPPVLANIDMSTNMKEEQELAAARAQLADCQRSIHVIRKQMTCEMQQLELQDVINYDQALFDTFSESSKSAEHSSHLPSPKLDNSLSYFAMPSSKSIIAKPIEDMLVEEEYKVLSYPLSLTSLVVQGGDGYPPKPQLSNVHSTKDMLQSLEPCKDHDEENKPKSFSYLVRSSSKDHVLKPTQNTSKPHKSSTASRISEFFSRAKSNARATDRICNV